jgi:GT2 family glycosyltransferase
MKKFLSRVAFQTGHKILSCPGPFNFSKLCNEGAKAAGSQYLLFLNNDVEILDNDWLGKMLAVAQHPKVAIVGATLLYSDYTLQHAGIFPQGDGTWQHAYRFQPADFAGYAGELRHVRIVPAVTGACFMIEKDLFNRLGGFNEELPVTHNDVDLCLRFNALGLKSAITPHARLFHFESISRGFFNKSFASNFE